MKKNILIFMIASSLGTGCAANNQIHNPSSDTIKTEIYSAFDLPAGTQQFCHFVPSPWKYQKFKLIRTDLNNDRIDEILLKCSTVDEKEEDLEPNRTWVVLQKACNGDYVCIGKIGTPLQITKRENCVWKTITGYALPDPDGEKNQELTVYAYVSNQYRALICTDSFNGISITKGIAELEKKFKEKMPKFSDEYCHLISAAGYLSESLDFTKELMLQMSSEQRKEFLKRGITLIKKMDSDFLRMMYAKQAALALMNLNDFQHSREMFEIALASQLKSAPNDSEGYVEILNNYAIVLSLSDYKKEAEQKFKEVLQTYRNTAKKDMKNKYNLASSILNLAVLHWEQKNYAVSEKELLESIQLFEVLPSGYWNEECISNWGNAYGVLATIYENTGRSAEEYYGKALNTFEKITEPQSMSFLEKYAETLNNASEFHKKNGNPEKALAEQKKAFEIWNKMTGTDQVFLPQLLESGHSLASLLCNFGDIENALQLFEEILKYRLQLAQKKGGKFVSAYFDTVISAVSAYVKAQKYAQAQQLLETAEKQHFCISGKIQNRFKIAQAAVYHCLGQYTKSANILEDVLRKTSSGDEHSSSCYHLGRTYLASGHVSKAEKILSNGIAVLKKDVPNIWLVRCLNQLAIVHWNMSNFQLAEKEYQESMNAFEKLKRTETVFYVHDYAVGAANLASLYRDIDKNSAAYALYIKIVPILKDNSFLAASEKAELLRNFGNTCMELNKFDEAKNNYRTALAIYEAEAKRNVNCMEKVAEVHFNLGNLFRQIKQFGMAEKEYLASGELYHDLGKKSNKTSCFMHESQAWNNLANMYSDMAKKEKAEKYFLAAMTLRKQYAENATEKASLAQVIFNLAWHYFQNDTYEKASALFAEGVQIARALNKEISGEYELLLARFLIFHALTCEENTEINKSFDEIDTLLNKHSNTLEAKQLHVIFKKVKETKTNQEKSEK